MKVAPVTRTRNDQTAGYIVNIVFFRANCWLLPKQTKSLRKFPVTFQRKTHTSLDLSKWAQKPLKNLTQISSNIGKYRQEYRQPAKIYIGISAKKGTTLGHFPEGLGTFLALLQRGIARSSINQFQSILYCSCCADRILVVPIGFYLFFANMSCVADALSLS